MEVRQQIEAANPSLAEGGLSERARQRALEIANDADLRIRPPKQFNMRTSAGRRLTRKLVVTDPRLPPPGHVLVRRYKDKSIVVTVRTDGFEDENRIHRSLSTIAREVTGTRWNGFLFFRIPQNHGDLHAER